MANQNMNISSEQYERYLIEEGTKIDSYLNTYYTKFKIPKPIPPTNEELSFWAIAGLESSIFVLSGLGAAALSAIRTGGLFFLMEVLLVKKYGLPPVLGSGAGIIALITSLLAFEGTLIGIGLVKGRESGKIKISTVSLIVSMTTVILASIFSSFAIVDVSSDNQLYMDITLALVTGIASSVTAYLSFENVGFIRNDVNIKREEMKKSFSNKYKAWEEGAIASYNSTRKNITNRIVDSDYAPTDEDIPSPVIQKNRLSKFETAYLFVQEYYAQNNSLPTNKVVSENAGVALGTAYSGIQKFIIDNYVELIEKGIVTQENVTEVSGKYFGGLIKEFIKRNNRFLKSEEINQFGIPQKELARYILDNQDYIVQNNLLDQTSIEQAKRIMSGEGN